jgi:hypothetical protein
VHSFNPQAYNIGRLPTPSSWQGNHVVRNLEQQHNDRNFIEKFEHFFSTKKVQVIDVLPKTLDSFQIARLTFNISLFSARQM